MLKLGGVVSVKQEERVSGNLSKQMLFLDGFAIPLRYLSRAFLKLSTVVLVIFLICLGNLLKALTA